MVDLILREGRASDIEALERLEQLCFTSPWSREALQRDMEDNQRSRYTVALLGDQVIGLGILWQVLDEGHIVDVAVHPDFRCRGIGRRLVLEMMAGSRREGGRRFTLEVRPTNLPARALYASLGFEEAGRRKHYYDAPVEDALILWLLDQEEEGKGGRCAP